MIENPYLGQIAAVAFDFAPRQWAWCDGRELPVKGNEALFEVLGRKYSDAAKTKFALPSMKDPMKGIRYVICLTGIFPPVTGRRPFEPIFIGMLCEWQSRRIPEESRPADGAILHISESEALFQLIGQKFGGSAEEGTVQLPNLGGKWIIAIAGMYPQP